MNYEAEIQGESGRWSTIIATKAQAEAMRKDGIEVIEVHNSMPIWVLDAGLASVWVFFQDIWNIPSRWFHK